MIEPMGLIVLLKSASVLLGGLITYFAFRAYRRTNARSLRCLSVGFGIITLGALLGGVVDTILVMTREWAITIESALAVVGFGVILYSLYVE
jgi:energy-converting hydrogenase Eha subunit F